MMIEKKKIRKGKNKMKDNDTDETVCCVPHARCLRRRRSLRKVRNLKSKTESETVTGIEFERIKGEKERRKKNA